LHVPAFLWAALIEFAGGICPLTPFENWLRQQGGAAGYSTSFIGTYFLTKTIAELGKTFLCS
jgi:hypothetical protein